MAKTKADFIAQGMADANAGHTDHKPKSGWQLESYTAGWEEAQDELATAAASKAAYDKRVKTPLFQPTRAVARSTTQRRVNDSLRRGQATVIKLAQREHRRNNQKSTTALHAPRGEYVTPNVKRGGSYR